MSFRTWMYVFAIGITFSAQTWGQTATEDEPRQEESTPDTDNRSNNEDTKAVDLTPALENIEAAIL